jgi:GTPase
MLTEVLRLTARDTLIQCSPGTPGEQEAKEVAAEQKSIAQRLSPNYWLLRTQPSVEGTIDEVRVSIVGAVDSGKSTLLGHLTTGVMDDGRGKARSSIFVHPHERLTGRTSSVAQHIIGFDERGEFVRVAEKRSERRWPIIVRRSSKILTFYDLAGHERYLRTTVHGLSFSHPDYSIILVEATRGVTKMTKEHLGICVSLGIPITIIVNKVDTCADKPHLLKNTLQTLKNLLSRSGVRKKVFNVRAPNDLPIVLRSFYNCVIVPLFQISVVTGDGMDLLKKFFNACPPQEEGKKRDVVETDPRAIALTIESKFNVRGVGHILGGQLESGRVRVGDKLHVGPDHSGKYHGVEVKSIHIKRCNVKEAEAGRYVTLAIRGRPPFEIPRGAAIVSEDNRVAVRSFKTRITVLRHSTTIKVGYEPVCHIGGVRRTCKITGIEEKKALRTGDVAVVELRLVQRPEYIKVGMKVLMCEGVTRCVGVVEAVSRQK